jgi:hypothetical protein
VLEREQESKSLRARVLVGPDGETAAVSSGMKCSVLEREYEPRVLFRHFAECTLKCTL